MPRADRKLEARRRTQSGRAGAVVGRSRRRRHGARHAKIPRNMLQQPRKPLRQHLARSHQPRGRAALGHEIPHTLAARHCLRAESRARSARRKTAARRSRRLARRHDSARSRDILPDFANSCALIAAPRPPVPTGDSIQRRPAPKHHGRPAVERRRLRGRGPRQRPRRRQNARHDNLQKRTDLLKPLHARNGRRSRRRVGRTVPDRKLPATTTGRSSSNASTRTATSTSRA